MGGSKTRPPGPPSFGSIFLLFLTLSWVFPPTHFVSAVPPPQQPIKTIVVLVMENRSFDHMLGWMKKAINPLINGVTGEECNPVSTNQTDPDSICFSDDADFVDPDPEHSFEAVAQQVFGSGSIPSMTGFVEQALSVSPNLSETVMKGFRPESVPVYAALVREFAVFDRWFSAIPGPTQPNRLFVYSATSHGSTSHITKKLAFGYPQKTIFDSLHENGMNFGSESRLSLSSLFHTDFSFPSIQPPLSIDPSASPSRAHVFNSLLNSPSLADFLRFVSRTFILSVNSLRSSRFCTSGSSPNDFSPPIAAAPRSYARPQSLCGV